MLEKPMFWVVGATALLLTACEPEVVEKIVEVEKVVEVEVEVEVEHDFQCDVSGVNFDMYSVHNAERPDFPDWYVDAELFLCETVEGTFNKVALIADTMDNELLILEDTKDAHAVVKTFEIGFGEEPLSFQTGEYAIKQCQKDLADADWDCWLVSTSNGNYLTSEM